MCTNRNFIAFACILAASALCQPASLAEAKDKPASSLAAPTQSPAPEVSYTNARELRSSVALSGNLSGAQQTGNEFLTVETTTIYCPRKNCRIEAVMSVQTITDAADNRFGICLTVDGAYDDQSCPVLGDLQPGTAIFTTSTMSAIKTGLPKGNHTVGVDFYSHLGAKIYRYFAQFKSFTK
jgi:hypothetical protein